MAGLSSRFFKAGYKEPKYKLVAHGKTLFQWSVKTFEDYYQTEKFIFICRNVYDTPAFISDEINKIGIKNFEIIVLEKETRGQAETVFLSLDKVREHEPFLIFNIDTYEKKFSSYESGNETYLEVFEGEGDHWSFAEPIEGSFLVKRTTEKNRISNLCSNGVYGFSDKNIYINAYIEMIRDNIGELYIAPMFNYIISKGIEVKYKLVDIDDHIFMGTPSEYTAFLEDKNV